MKNPESLLLLSSMLLLTILSGGIFGKYTEEILAISAVFFGLIGAVAYIIKAFRYWRNNHPVIEFHHRGFGRNGKPHHGIEAVYKRGTLPVTLDSFIVVIYRDYGLAHYSASHLPPTSLSPSNRVFLYDLHENTQIGDKVIGIAMQSVTGEYYYSKDYPEEHKAPKRSKIKDFLAYYK